MEPPKLLRTQRLELLGARLVLFYDADLPNYCIAGELDGVGMRDREHAAAVVAKHLKINHEDAYDRLWGDIRKGWEA
jgi:hypothetical protein